MCGSVSGSIPANVGQPMIRFGTNCRRKGRWTLVDVKSLIDKIFQKGREKGLSDMEVYYASAPASVLRFFKKTSILTTFRKVKAFP